MDIAAGAHQAYPPTTVRPSASPVHVKLSRRMVALFLGLLLVPWGIVLVLFVDLRYRASREGADRFVSGRLPNGSGSTEGSAGRWGRLEYTPIRIDLPDEFVYIPPPDHPPIRWFFKGYSPARALEFLGTAGLSSALYAHLQAADWKTTPDGAAVEPGDALVLEMSPAARAKIYSLLVEFPENSQQINPVWFRQGQVDERLKGSGLAPDSVDLLKKLLYPGGSSLLLFTDFETASRQLPNNDERRRFHKAVCRKKTLLARLRIDRDSNLDSLASYWGAGGRHKDVGPLLQALQQEGDGNINILCVLPPFIRERLYTYPCHTSGNQGPLKEDCFWSAMNIFHDPPDDRYNDMQYTHQTLKRDYYAIVTPSQLGDLVFLTTRDDTVVHAAAYIADDVVFTKNGTAYIQPWILMHLPEMVDTYAVRYPQSGPLKTVFFRKKN